MEAAADLLAAKTVTALPVLDDDGALVGMVSEGICCGTECLRIPPRTCGATSTGKLNGLTRSVPGVTAVDLTDAGPG